MERALQDLTSQVAELLKQYQLTIATAESCTGGWIGKELTAIAGSSSFFNGGIIAYSNEVKQKLLNVSLETINEDGAVSETVAQAMACGAKQVLESDIAIAVTGIAGPTGGTEEKPVGTVWFAWALPEKLSKHGNTVITDKQVFAGSREDVRLSTVLHALEKIKQILAEHKRNN